MPDRLTPVTCPVCGTDALYTPRSGWVRHYHDVRWYVDLRGRVVARWTTGDGAGHEVVALAEQVYCQACHRAIVGPRVWDPRDRVAPWPKVFFPGA